MKCKTIMPSTPHSKDYQRSSPIAEADLVCFPSVPTDHCFNPLPALRALPFLFLVAPHLFFDSTYFCCLSGQSRELTSIL